MQEPKFDLTEVSKEETDAFMKDFQDLLKKHSLYFEPVPQYTRDTLTSPWKTVCQVFLKKKIPIVEKAIPSPFTPDETTTETA